MSLALNRIRQVARQRKKERFTSLFHHISIDHLADAFSELKENAAPGVDGLTWRAYEADLDHKIADLYSQLYKGVYRAQPSRRVYIPKLDGSAGPARGAALEHKIVQRVAIAVLNAIYEEGFFGFSYGNRPKRSQRDALDALIVGVTSKKVNYILDADVRSCFDSVSQDWLIRFLMHGINDPRMIRLIQKWMNERILKDGIITVSETRTEQRSVASPLLFNVYLHYVFDPWAERWRRRQATGDMIILRYADDIIVAFCSASTVTAMINCTRAFKTSSTPTIFGRRLKTLHAQDCLLFRVMHDRHTSRRFISARLCRRGLDFPVITVRSNNSK